MQSKENSTSGSYILWTATNNGYHILQFTKQKLPLDLINDQLGDVTAEIRNTYKQKNSFETELK
jgi:hypothetical protein